MQIRGKQRRFVAPGAGPDLDDRGAIIERIRGDQERLEVGLDRRNRLLEAGDLRPGERRHFGVLIGNELARLHELVIQFFEPIRQSNHGAQPLVLPAQRTPGVGVSHGLRIE